MKGIPITESSYKIYQYLSHTSEGGLDWTGLGIANQEVVNQVFDFFFEPGFELKDLEFGLFATATINRFQFQAKTYYKKRGGQLLGIGFPVYSVSGASDVKAFPLFICRVKLNQSNGKYTIRRIRSLPIEPNYQLLNYLKSERGIDLFEAFEDFTAEQSLSAGIFEQFIGQFADLVCGEKYESHNDLKSFQPIKSTAKEAFSDGLQTSAFLGCFPQQLLKTSTIYPLTPQELNKDGHPFGVVRLDPFGANAYEDALYKPNLLVKGPQGSGKTEVGIQLVSNALSNGQRCLVLSSHLAPLRSFQKRLSNTGIRQPGFLYQHLVEDHALLVDYLQAFIPGSRHKSSVQPPRSFAQQLGELTRLKKKLDDQYLAAKKEIISGYHWTALVGKYLNSNRNSGRERLSVHLNAQDFSFNDQEYITLVQPIGKSHRLFSAVHDLNSALGKLNPGIFQAGKKDAVHDEVVRKLDFFLQKGIALTDRYAKFLTDYEGALFLHYDQLTGKLLQQAGNVLDLIEEGYARFGKAFDWSTHKLNIRAWFFGRAKKVLKQKGSIERAYQELVDLFSEASLFPFEFPQSLPDNPASYAVTLKQFREQLNSWRLEINRIIEEEKARLSIQTIFPALKLTDILQGLSYDLDLFVDQINKEEFLANPIEQNQVLVTHQQNFLEQFVLETQSIQQDMWQFSAFFDWQSHYLKLSLSTRKIIDALVKTNPEYWLDTFESWYWNQCLIKFNNVFLPVDHEDLGHYANVYQAFLPTLITQINERVEALMNQGINEFKKQQKALYQALFLNKGATGQIVEQAIVNAGLGQLFDALPLLLTTPHIFTRLIQQHAMSAFDLIIVEEAHTLHSDTIEVIKEWGNRVVLLYDEAQSVDSVKVAGGINQFLKNQAWPVFELNMLHQWQPGNLFSVMGKRKLDPRFSTVFTVDFHQIDGRYHDNDRTNGEEADFVLKCLNDISETPQRTFPKVGIVCFTTEQAALIYGYLERIKQQDLAGGDRIKQLERNGLQVCTVPDIVGEAFDVLILDVTFGVIDLKGTLTTDLLSFNEPDAQVLLKRLIASDFKSLVVINSLPLRQLKEYMLGKSGPGLFILSMYLLYLKALSTSDVSEQETVIAKFQTAQKQSIGHGEADQTSFLSAVIYDLRPVLRGFEIIEPFNKGNLNFPYVVRHPSLPEKYFYFVPDGFFSNHPTVDYAWEKDQIDYLKEMGFEAIWVWSVNWWKNKQREIDRIIAYLASEIPEMELSKMDNQAK